MARKDYVRTSLIEPCGITAGLRRLSRRVGARADRPHPTDRP